VSLVDALQAALAVEHQVVYGYGVVGARQRGAARRDAGSCLTRHQGLRDALARLVVTRGGTPVPAEPAYALPFAVDGALAAATLGARLEDATSGAAWDVLAVTTATDTRERHLGISALTSSAEWSARWRAASGEPALPPFPGQPTASQPSTTPTSSSS
jgi:hypothetical protein